MNETVIVVEAEGRAGAWACRSLGRAGFRVVGTAGSASAARAARSSCDAVRLVPSPQVDGAGFVQGLVETIEPRRCHAAVACRATMKPRPSS